MCPTCGLSCTVMPQTYMPTWPAWTGTNSRLLAVRVSYTRSIVSPLLCARRGGRALVRRHRSDPDVAGDAEPHPGFDHGAVQPPAQLARHFLRIGAGHGTH